MEIINLISNKGNKIDGPILFTPKLTIDERGFFYESWNKKVLDDLLGRELNFLQDNHSKSKKFVLRGLHFQTPKMAQGKLVRCTNGKVFDVAVDIRKSSPTFKEWISVDLNDENRNIFWIPEGFAHGFLSLSTDSELQYKTNEFWNKESERSILWNDKTLNIDWPLKFINNDIPILNEKDLFAPSLNELNWRDDLFA